MELNPVDIASLVILLVLGLRAAIRGFVTEFLAVAGVLLGALAGWLFSANLANLLGQWIGPGPLNQVLAFAALFVLVFLLMLIFRSALQHIVNGFELERLDHVLGTVVGVLEGLVLVFLLVILIELLNIEALAPTFHGSVTWNFFHPFIAEAQKAVNAVVPALPLAGDAVQAAP